MKNITIKVIDNQTEIKFKVPFLLRLKFIIVFIIHAIGRNKFKKTYQSAANNSLIVKQDVFLKDLVKRKKDQLIIGTALNNLPEQNERTIVNNEFNSITPENILKWGYLLKENVLGTYDFTVADRLVDFSLQHNINVRGHALFWGKVPGMGFPKDLQEILNCEKNPKMKLLSIMENHLSIVLNHYRGKINVWDVINEPFELSGSQYEKNIYYRYLGIDYIEEAFNAVHSIDSSLRLVLNEQIDNYDGKRAYKYLKLIEDLLNSHTPLHSIGIQSHILFELPSIKKVYLFLKRLSSLGLSFEITEFDLRIGLFKYAKDPYQAQADYAKSFFEVFVKFPEFLGFTFWSCFDNENWMDRTMPFSLLKPNSPCLFDTELVKKPLYHTISNLLRYST